MNTQQALLLHRALVEDTLERLARVQRADLERRIYLSEPWEGRQELSLPPAWTLALQRGDDLGVRLETAFREAFEQGREKLVILGSDSPTLPLDYVDQAFDELAERDVILGPAEDGGYYLIGCSTFVPELFRGIAWGSDRVLAQSRERLSEAGRTFEQLPAWYDIDSEKDLVRLRRELEELANDDPGQVPRRTAAVLAGIPRPARDATEAPG